MLAGKEANFPRIDFGVATEVYPALLPEWMLSDVCRLVDSGLTQEEATIQVITEVLKHLGSTALQSEQQVA